MQFTENISKNATTPRTSSREGTSITFSYDFNPQTHSTPELFWLGSFSGSFPLDGGLKVLEGSITSIRFAYNLKASSDLGLSESR
jgi:hypothetical protein